MGEAGEAKDTLLAEANKLNDDREQLRLDEARKAIARLPPELCCEQCGTVYVGKEEEEPHKAFRIHKAFVELRERVEDLRPRVREWEEKSRERIKDKGKAKEADGGDNKKSKESKDGSG